MSTYLERIRERLRRANAKRAKRRGAVRQTPEAEALQWVAGDGAIDGAIDLDLDAAAGSESTAHELEQPAGAGVDDEHGDELEQGAAAEADAKQPEATSEAPAEESEATATGTLDEAGASAVILLEFGKSSTLRSAELGVDGVVAVTFADGTVTRYGNFTLDLMAEWESAKSAGSWFHNNVRTKPDRHPIVEG